MNRIKPVRKQVLIEPITERESSRGGILIPDKFQDQSTEGTVVALATNADNELRIGDRVFFARFGGTEVKQSGRMFRLMNRNEIFAVIENA